MPIKYGILGVAAALPVAVACVVWAVLGRERGVEMGIPLAICATLYTVLMRRHGPRVLVRAGAWPRHVAVAVPRRRIHMRERARALCWQRPCCAAAGKCLNIRG